MKKSALFIAIISLAISACSTQKQATSAVGDDVYNSGSGHGQSVTHTTAPSTTGAQVITSPDNATVKKPASSTFADDYNDYSYSSRIDRFNSKDTTKGYFDNSYSGSGSGSNNGSSDPNVNVYVGAGYGGYYGSSLSFGIGWGYPYSNWGWDYGWGYPYYGYGYPYYGYGYGYGYPYYGYYDPWYSCCYCYGYGYGGYPPYYSSGSYYYGARTSLYGHDGGGSSNPRTTADNSYNTVQHNERSGTVPAAYARTSSPNPGQGVPVNQQQYRYTRAAGSQQTSYQRSVQSTTRSGSGNQNHNQRQQPVPRYSRPGESGSAQRSGSTQSYSSPVYRQPKSSREYLTPRSQNPGSERVSNQNSGNSYNPGTSKSGTRQNAVPSNNTGTFTQPSRSGSSGYTAPARSGSNYSAPVRSGSSGTYSAPSNSGGSGTYSAPARSGGSGGGAPSGGGGGGGSGSGGGHRR